MKSIHKSKLRKIILASILLFGFLYIINANHKTPYVFTKEETLNNINDSPIPSVIVENRESKIILGTESKVSSHNRQTAKVVGVRDGDTIEVDLGGGNFKTVRYIGIDTPESVDPRKTVECFGNEASNVNITLVMNKTVELEKDVSETDKYGRLLRYVYVDNIFVNQYLVEEGFAHSSAYPPDVKYQEDLDSAEEEARISNKGLWSACNERSSQNKLNSKNPDDMDCSDFKSQKEAQFYFDSKGGSSSNNVDKLDGSDRDGIVCETLP